MTDFKKIEADGFEINAKALDNNPDDAAARSYMLVIMMAKHLDDDHVKREKRYVIDKMNFFPLLLTLVISVSIGSSYAYALEYTYPTIKKRLTVIPTSCAFESISDEIESSDIDEMIAKSELSFMKWKEKLQESELIKKEFWDMKFKKIGKNESVTDDCTITILFRDDPEFSGSLLSKTLGAFMRNSIYVYYENQQSIHGDKWMDGIFKTIIHCFMILFYSCSFIPSI